MGGSQSSTATETEEERRRYRQNFRRISIGAVAAWDAHPAVDIAISLDRCVGESDCDTTTRAFSTRFRYRITAHTYHLEK
jgi:hypothetical protein